MRAEAVALLDAARGGRGVVKRLAARLDADPALREAVVAEARRRGADVPDDLLDAPGKRLLRACLDRSDAARVRKNPIARDEAFDCAHCGHAVAPHGRTARDHCPRCLYSLHVDVVPGDRAAGCGGLLAPVAATLSGGRWTLDYTCRACGARRRNQAILDGDDPDDVGVLAALGRG